MGEKVASYLDSTSNHNHGIRIPSSDPVASYLDSTSNHNLLGGLFGASSVASYLDSTSNHNLLGSEEKGIALLHILILHQTTTKRVFFLSNALLLHILYLQPIITQYFIDNKSEIWLLFLIAHSKR